MSKNSKTLQEEQVLENEVDKNKVSEVEAQPEALVKSKKQIKENKSNKKDDKKQNKKKERKQNSLLKKIKEVFSELKKVSWPSFGKVVKQTGVVIAVVIIFTVILFGIDRLLALLFGLLIPG